MAKRLKIDCKKKKNKWRLINFKESPVDSDMLSSVHTEIFGSSRITIDGCLGVYEYRDTYLKLRLSKGTLIICGSGFNIVYFENRLISIKGKITAIEFV